MKKLPVFVFLAACGGAVTNGDAGTGQDAAKTGGDAQSEASTIPDASAFCSGTSPRLMINGADAPVMNVSGKALALNCCDSAELLVATSAYQAMLDVMWSAPAPSSGTSPVDLGSPPQNFTIELDLGCDPSATSCATASPEERYTSGFQGTLQYAQDSSGLTTGYCFSVAESPTAPHAVIHSLMFYTPAIICAY